MAPVLGARGVRGVVHNTESFPQRPPVPLRPTGDGGCLGGWYTFRLEGAVRPGLVPRLQVPAVRGLALLCSMFSDCSQAGALAKSVDRAYLSPPPSLLFGMFDKEPKQVISAATAQGDTCDSPSALPNRRLSLCFS